MAFNPGVAIETFDASGRTIISPDTQVANQNLFIEGQAVTAADGVQTVCTPITIMSAGVAIPFSLVGVEFEVKNHLFQDMATLEVVDVDNVLGLGAGVVLGNFGNQFVVPHSGKFSVMANYKKDFVAGLYLRLTYNAQAGGVSREITINYYLLQ